MEHNFELSKIQKFNLFKRILYLLLTNSNKDEQLWSPYLSCNPCSLGHNVSELGEIDGVDMWEALVSDKTSPRKEFVHNIDDVGDVYAALRKGDWKYIKGKFYSFS